jgi:outer membrane protein OmpA-like peptidoglycan-associated protein
MNGDRRGSRGSRPASQGQRVAAVILLLMAAGCAGSKPVPAPEARPSDVERPSSEPAKSAAHARGENWHDIDGDRILIDRDRCPDQAETYNGYEDEDGCPDPEHTPDLTLRLVITFKERSAELERNPTVEDVIEMTTSLLRQRNDLILEIGGHADAAEETGKRTDLSKRRANAVKAAFVGKGIAKERLVVRAYGSSCPETTETTDVARSQNRRITFQILGTQSGGPTDPKACP